MQHEIIAFLASYKLTEFMHCVDLCHNRKYFGKFISITFTTTAPITENYIMTIIDKASQLPHNEDKIVAILYGGKWYAKPDTLELSNGILALTRRGKCGLENYAMNVLSGVCTWCGFDVNKEVKNEC